MTHDEGGESAWPETCPLVAAWDSGVSDWPGVAGGRRPGREPAAVGRRDPGRSGGFRGGGADVPAAGAGRSRALADANPRVDAVCALRPEKGRGSPAG